MKKIVLIFLVIALLLTVGIASAAERISVPLSVEKNLVKINPDLIGNVLPFNDYVTFLTTPVQTGGGPLTVTMVITSMQHISDPSSGLTKIIENAKVTYFTGFVTYDKPSNSLIAKGDQIVNSNLWSCTQVCKCSSSGSNVIDVSQYSFNPKMTTPMTATISVDSKALTLSNGESFTLTEGPTDVYYGQTDTVFYTVTLYKHLEVIG